MAHTPLEALNNRCAHALNMIEIGAIYSHYRNHELNYKVLMLALDEETEEMCVVYQALYGEQLIWIRKLTKWSEMVEHNGKNVPRFNKTS